MTLASTSPAVVDEAVQSPIERVYAAWNANGVNAFVEPYADAATATLPGRYLASKAALRAAMSAAFAGPLKGSHICHEFRAIRRVGNGVAIASVKSAVVLDGEQEPTAEHIAIATWVVSATNDAWQVEAYHECPSGDV
jgi:uncharacterized protein (TIGR02246 family)